MKKIIGLVVILAALVLAGYYGMGMVTEKTIKQTVAIADRSTSIFVDVTSYNRGWFTSTTNLHWRLHIPEQVNKDANGQSSIVPAQDYEIDMPLTIYHGPIIFAGDGVHFGLGYAYTLLTLPPAYAPMFSSVFTETSEKPQIDMNILVNYFNQSRLGVKLPKFTLVAKENQGTFEWFGMNNDVTFSSKLDKIKGRLNIDGMRFIKNNIKGDVGKITSDYDAHRTLEGLYIGKADLSIPNIMVTNEKDKLFELNDFDLSSHADEDNGLISNYIDWQIKKVIVNGRHYGPGVLKIALKNLDAETLARINQQLTQIQEQGSTEKQQQQVWMTVVPEIPKLLSKGPVFEVSTMNLTMPEGNIEGSVNFVLPAGDTTNPFQMIQKIKGEGQLKVPALILKRIIQESWKQQLLKNPNATVQAQTIANEMQKQADPNAPVSTTQETPAAAKNTVDDPNAVPTVGKVNPEPATDVTGLDLDKRAEAQAVQTLQGLVQAGLIIQVGETYQFKFKLADGQFIVNDHPFDPSAIKL